MLMVLAGAAVATEPDEGALDHAAPGEDVEVGQGRILGNDLQHGVNMLSNPSDGTHSRSEETPSAESSTGNPCD